MLEETFNRPFPKIRPEFLRNPETGRCLELDAFNEELGLALEVNGIQHRAYVPFLHGNNPDNFDMQRRRDRWKRQRCREMGVTLIEVNDTEVDAEGYLRNEIRRWLQQLPQPSPTRVKPVDSRPCAYASFPRRFVPDLPAPLMRPAYRTR